MRMKRIGKLNRKGMTLVEVIVAIAILSIVVAPTLRIFASTSGTNLKSRQRQRATSVAEGTMESFKAYDMRQLCDQFRSNSFTGVVSVAGTTMSVKAFRGSLEVSPLCTDGTLRGNVDRYEFKVNNTSSEGHMYDVDIVATPVYGPGTSSILKMEPADAYSDAIIYQYLDETSCIDAWNDLADMAVDKCEDNFSTYHPTAISHTIDSNVDISNFKRVVDLEVSDNGTAQTVTMKITYTCDAKVNYTYTTGAGGSNSGYKTYDASVLKLEAVVDDADGAPDPKTLKVYDNSGTIGGVEVLGKKSKLNQIYLYYFPAYSEAFGTGAEDEINISGNLSILYDLTEPGASGPTAVEDSRAKGYGPLKINIIKQVSTRLSDVDLSISEVRYKVHVNGAVTGGKVELQTNLDEKMSTQDVVIATPNISGFPTSEKIKDAVVDTVPLLYNVDIRVYEAGTPEDQRTEAAQAWVARFQGTMNE